VQVIDGTDTPVAGVGSIPVSVLLLTLNEEVNIRRCIKALSWSDDVVVLDSGSTDDTCAVARSLGARIFERPFDNFAEQRNYALDHIEFRHEWVLHLDADEVVTPELRDEMAQAIEDSGYGAYRLASKLLFRGQWLKYSGMYPTYQARLGRRDELRFQQVGHGQRETIAAERLGTLQQPYLHYVFSKGIADWIERHNRYSTDEARQNVGVNSASVVDLLAADSTERRRALKSLTARLPSRPLLRLLYMYVLRLGFLDGRAGWSYCRLLAMYEYWTLLKERELRQAGLD
jgi:glycosyltransferase involved in cell wall biosynthesis